MKTKQWLILLTSCLALAAAPLTGCGDDTDPSANNGTNNGGGNNGGNDAGNEDAGDEDTSEPQDSGNNDTGDASDEDGSGGDLGTCETNDFFTGQAYAEGDGAHFGGNPLPASEVTLESAGLQAIYDAIPVEDAPQDDFDTADVDEGIVELETPLAVDGALVIATGRSDRADTADVIEGNDWLYVQDGDTTLVLNSGFVGSLYPDGEAPTEAIKIGDMVSFTATAVRNYSGTPQVARLTDFTVDSSDNDVPYTDLTGQEITMDNWGQLVRISGQLVVEQGECGGSSICYDLLHPDDPESGQTITFRSNSQYVEKAKCVTFFGPLGAFPGPIDRQGGTPAPQIDEVNWDWTYTGEPVTD